MIDIAALLGDLAAERPIFHSEADFQHALAWQFHRRHPDASIRLEYPVPEVEKPLYLDIWISQGHRVFAVELKYKTRALSVRVADERFSLKNQSAQDLARYDFVRDIWRLEQIVLSHDGALGWAILLTNDSTYWKAPRNDETMDAAFRLHEGRLLQGILGWNPRASEGTIRGREEPIQLDGTYALRWQDYSQPSQIGYGRFRYLAVKVEGRAG